MLPWGNPLAISAAAWTMPLPTEGGVWGSSLRGVMIKAFYGHPVYATIVRELGLVDSRSISAEPAAAMADELQAQIQAFMQKQLENKENRNKNRSRTQPNAMKSS